MGLEEVKEVFLLKKELIWLWAFWLIIFCIALFTLLFIQVNSNLFFFMSAAKGHYIGAFTNIFLDGTWKIYFDEIIGIFPFLVFFVIFLLPWKINSKKEYIKFLILVSLIIGLIITQVSVYLSNYNSEYGQSAIGYAQAGIITALGFTSLLSLNDNYRKKRNSINIILMGIYSMVLITLIIYLIFFRSSFFNINPQVNYVLHEWSFLIGFISWFIYFYIFNKSDYIAPSALLATPTKKKHKINKMMRNKTNIILFLLERKNQCLSSAKERITSLSLLAFKDRYISQ